ncbi:hypothetical protein H0I25_02870 [Cellulophaga sp. HaHa_2_95]|nr:hypothetical protein [Cellulophaga sp. HaHa_2_95]QXP56754.1 hypothetical protein H0I25_02870 [Cellulophaga sp. HaHa_2_95]
MMTIHEQTYGVKTNGIEEINAIFANCNKFIIGIGVVAIIQFSILYMVL